jgi:hypothetical protein
VVRLYGYLPCTSLRAKAVEDFFPESGQFDKSGNLTQIIFQDISVTSPLNFWNFFLNYFHVTVPFALNATSEEVLRIVVAILFHES